MISPSEYRFFPLLEGNLCVLRKQQHAAAALLVRGNHRREGKGRCCCLRNGIHSIPCRTTDLAPGWFAENMNWRTRWIEERTLSRMNASEKWMIIWITPPTPNHHPPKMDVLPKTFLPNTLAAKWIVLVQVRPPKKQRRLCLLFCLFLLLWSECFSQP